MLLFLTKYMSNIFGEQKFDFLMDNFGDIDLTPSYNISAIN